MRTDRRTAVVVLGLWAVVTGAWGVIVSLGDPFTAKFGAALGRYIFLNPAGSWFTLICGLLAIGGAVAGVRFASALPGLLFGLAMTVTLVTVNTSANILGGRMNTMAFFMTQALGLLALAVVPELRPDESREVQAEGVQADE